MSAEPNPAAMEHLTAASWAVTYAATAPSTAKAIWWLSIAQTHRGEAQ